MSITISSWCLCPLQVSMTLTQRRFNAGPSSPAPAITHATPRSASCWCQCAHRVHADTDPMTAKCWASIAGAGQHRFDIGQGILLAGHTSLQWAVQSYTPYIDPMLSQCWPIACNGAVTPVQTRPIIVSQRMSTRMKFFAVAVSSAAQKHWAFNAKVGLMLGKLKFHQLEVPTAFVLLHRHILVFLCEMETHSEGPVNTLTCLSVDEMLYHCLRRSPNIKTTWSRKSWINPEEQLWIHNIKIQYLRIIM